MYFDLLLIFLLPSFSHIRIHILYRFAIFEFSYINFRRKKNFRFPYGGISHDENIYKNFINKDCFMTFF